MNITKVTWHYWSGNTKRTDYAYFKSREAASKFIEGLVQEREVEDVKIEEGLSTKDVKAE